MFTGAKNTVIYGGEFHAHSSSSTTGSSSQVWREGLRTLREHVAPGAAHNSAQRYDPPKCHPQTRKAVIKKIMDWIKKTDKLSLFLWLYGPAGAGKSAIAQTIAELCQKLKLLIASFFFSRSAAGRSDKDRFATTLAHQISTSIPELREHIGNALDLDPMIVSSSLETQIQTLIVDPLNELCEDENVASRLHRRPRLIIIDGLDECVDTKSQQDILRVLSAASKDSQYPLIFLIASRPETSIRNAFRDFDPSVETIVLDDSYHPDADIKIFLESRFEEIRKNHPSGPQLPQAWPSEEQIQQLVRKASGQFIYASTVMKFVDSPNYLPQDRLGIIFELSRPRHDSEEDSEVLPFTELDTLYHHILSSVYDIEKVLEILSLLTLTSSFNFPRSPSMIENLFFYKYGEVYTILADMHSIIYVPSPEGEEGELRLLHASLSDFLFDEQRSVEFFIDPGQAHSRFTRHYIRHLETLLNNYDTKKGLSVLATLHPANINTAICVALSRPQQIARRFLLRECSQSSANEDLMQALAKFDIEAFLNLCSSLPYMHQQLSALPKFFDWLVDQPSDKYTDVIELYEQRLAHFFFNKLVHRPINGTRVDHLRDGHADSLALNADIIFRHPSFLTQSGVKLAALVIYGQLFDYLWGDMGSDSSTDCHQGPLVTHIFLNQAVSTTWSATYSPWFSRMLRTFFLFVHPHYISFRDNLVLGVAWQIMQTVTHQEMTPNEEHADLSPVEIVAMRYLAELLPCCPTSHEFATGLRDSSMPFDEEYPNLCYYLDTAITRYLDRNGVSRTPDVRYTDYDMPQSA
ncbi:hypothetical protein NLJ89_g5209 [Agrocybe chaxingu]|uniref:Nephrocystin 3-like N-terminal domain-containing protein n=1 Tax=Agrocybe chaxingu TaxID=84603 RepID=A0A9W8MVT9_9AGAR|nr:hypothetical protein NLJ89_g5209 [Agrocybe chaxingu]